VVQGLDLLHRVGEVAEQEGHHPDLHLEVRATTARGSTLILQHTDGLLILQADHIAMYLLHIAPS
jgi:pterin-4a-carbinolamine dehydratase